MRGPARPGPELWAAERGPRPLVFPLGRGHARRSYTLKEIERAIKQAGKAHQRVVELDQEPNLALALRTASERLESARKELFQTTYFGTDQQKLL